MLFLLKETEDGTDMNGKKSNTGIILIICLAILLIAIVGIAALLLIDKLNETQETHPLVVSLTAPIKVHVTNQLGLTENTNFTIVESFFNETVFVRVSNTSTVTILNLPINRTYDIGLSGESHYPTNYKFFIENTDGTEWNLSVNNYPTDLTFTITNKTSEDYILNLSTNFTITLPAICFKWGIQVISIVMDKPIINKPSRLRYFDRCYQFSTITNSTLMEQIKIKKANTFNSIITVVLIDKVLLKEYVAEAPDGTDIGYPDQNLTIVV